jgi:phosphoribosylamine---glycine ligase
VIEYNCRFGDPECQAVMPLVKGDLAGFCLAGANGELRGDLISFDDGWSVCVILASAGYPGKLPQRRCITGLGNGDFRVYHAGTRKNADGDLGNQRRPRARRRRRRQPPARKPSPRPTPPPI